MHAAVRAGISVLKPLLDERYDLVFDLGTRLIGVQCKWAVRSGDVLLVRCRWCRRCRNGLIHRPYSSDGIDAFAAYCADLDRCFYFPIAWVRERKGIQLRLTPARNNQRAGINWADDFDFERLDWSALTGP
jgi:hypothetical protein